MNSYMDNAYRFDGIMTIQQYPFLSMDLIRLCCGKKIGNGESRDVYDCKIYPGYVIKVTHYNEHNWNEYNIWEAVKDSPYRKWFAPVKEISPAGNSIIMKKAKPITDNTKLPKSIPEFFTDVKRENFGIIDGRLVAIDYQHLIRAIDISFNCSHRKLIWNE